jgi:hypothetical protein
MDLVTPKAAAEHELLFNKQALSTELTTGGPVCSTKAEAQK